jgi:hypothetical protein
MGAVRQDRPSGDEQALDAFRKQVRYAVEHGREADEVMWLWLMSGDVERDALIDAFKEETGEKPRPAPPELPGPGSVQPSPFV